MEDEDALNRLLESTGILPQGRQPRLPVLEICSEENAAGKTHLVYHIIAKAILPDIHGTTVLGGQNKAVVLIDTNTRLDVERLVQVITTYVMSKVSEEEPITDMEDLIERSLQHVHIFQPRSMASLLEALSGLREYLLDPSAHLSSNRAIHSIAIDSASAFYWETRAALEDERLNALNAKAPGASVADMPPPKPNPYALLVNRLRSLQRELSCAVVATTTATRYKDANTGEVTIRTLPAPWPSFPTTKLMIKREQVRKFDPGISWEDAEKDKLLRQEAVEKSAFVAASMADAEDQVKFLITEDGIQFASETKESEPENEQEVADDLP